MNRGFRVYDKQEKRMIDTPALEGIFLAGNGNLVNKNDLYSYLMDRYIRMDDTGLKDSKGKDIYEGDIIRLSSGAAGLVHWNDDIDTDRYWWIASGFSIYIEYAKGTYDMETLEVIGNAWTNPELLKEAE
jgi:uncharacterized phage protein (TIGR01671 family)